VWYTVCVADRVSRAHCLRRRLLLLLLLFLRAWDTERRSFSPPPTHIGQRDFGTDPLSNRRPHSTSGYATRRLHRRPPYHRTDGALDMCMPSDHNNAAVISYADIFAAMPVQPLPPTRPPYQRQRRHRQQRPIPSLTAVPESTAREDTATTVTTTPKRTLRCTCHNTPAAMRSSVKRRTTATDDVTLSIRLFISLSIAILASKLIADAMYAARVDGLSVTNPRLYKTKRQLPPIEQGNMVIDSIFQVSPPPQVKYYRNITLSHRFIDPL